jgi:nitrogen fixation-related uncharacterized protein
MILVHGLIWGSWVIFGITTIWGLVWAVRTGQFQRLDQGARSIFDDEEPVGQMTDVFPDTDPEVLERLNARGGEDAH